MTSITDISAAGTVALGDLTVPRLGFGAMRLPGPRVWGPPADRDEAIRVVRRAIELGVRVIDSAWYYGLDVANEIIAAALRPYPEDLVLITKLGGARSVDGGWYNGLTPEGLRAGNERDRRVLGLDAVPVTHLRWMDGAPITFDEALEVMLDLQQAGKIVRIGLSNVTAAYLDAALQRTPIVSVSNHFGPDHQDDVSMLERCEAAGIAYLPFFPLGAGAVARRPGEGRPASDRPDALAAIAAKHGVTPAAASIAWLLHRSPVMLPIPGTGRVAHLEENVAAARIVLDADDMALLSA
jgi:aryl-alcohol dehydrogenase-like predicted oxidoreductase